MARLLVPSFSGHATLDSNCAIAATAGQQERMVLAGVASATVPEEKPPRSFVSAI